MHPASLFTYGTLRPSLYAHALSTFGLVNVGMATLRGPFKLYNLGSFPGLVKDFDYPCAPIYGEVVNVMDLIRCDRYEGCKYGAPTGNLYNREEVAVKMNDGSTMKVWVYLLNVEGRMKDDMSRHTVIPSGDWAKR